MFYSAAKILFYMILFYKVLLAEVFSQPITTKTKWLYLGHNFIVHSNN
jgi:hypothetical protein